MEHILRREVSGEKVSEVSKTAANSEDEMKPRIAVIGHTVGIRTRILPIGWKIIRPWRDPSFHFLSSSLCLAAEREGLSRFFKE